MICDLCGKNNAELFIEHETLFKNRRISLCKFCAALYGITDGNKNNVDIESIFQNVEKVRAKRDPDSQKVCPVCKTNFYEIKNSFILGCPNCYSVFKNELTQILSKENIEFQYSGIVPNESETENESSLLNRAAIQSKLEESVKAQDYEKAAVYRDYLNNLDKNCIS